ncbi:MAG TPA: hypothetical protein VN045_03000 [Microbacteriaceae bacterium]|jgi:hypothetical protein|nr:hypothetical protein [Microbacteriaceae bacterium]
MFVRRAFYYWQFIAALALPVWLLVGWGVFGGSGWGLLGLLLVCPIAFVALLAIAMLIYARKSVRSSRAVSWIDVGLLALWHLSIIGVGFYGAGANWFGVGAIVVAIAAFWIVLWELVTETRARVASAFASIDANAQAAAQPQAPRGPQGTFSQDGDVIIIRESGTDGRGPAHA